MKKSTKVSLTVVAVVGLASCGRSRRDPCEQAYFSELACQEAVRSGGYYWGGSWYPMRYHYPYPYYYDSYRGYVSHGGIVRSVPYGSYGRPGGSVSAPSSTPRGGFGSTGAAHSSGGGGGE
jgi:hypothetical protein